MNFLGIIPLIQMRSVGIIRYAFGLLQPNCTRATNYRRVALDVGQSNLFIGRVRPLLYLSTSQHWSASLVGCFAIVRCCFSRCCRPKVSPSCLFGTEATLIERCDSVFPSMPLPAHLAIDAYDRCWPSSSKLTIRNAICLPYSPTIAILLFECSNRDDQ